MLLLAAASGVMGALRHAINEAWDIHTRPPLLRRKLLDLALVLGGTVVLALSLSLTATRRLAEVFDEDEAGGSRALLDGLGDVLPFSSPARVLFLYRVLPTRARARARSGPARSSPRCCSALVRGALELYFEELSDFGALYGSLGALMALLLFVFARRQRARVRRGVRVGVVAAATAGRGARERRPRPRAPPGVSLGWSKR